MAQLSLATSEQSSQLTIGGGASYLPSPVAPPVNKPVNDLIPVSISFPVLKPSPAGTASFDATTKPSGCGGGGCPLAQPPAGGTVTITRSDMAPGPAALASDAGLSFLTRVIAGLPLWVWLLILFLALVAIVK